MLDDEIANRVVKKCIRIVGGLGTSHPIEMQDALGELLITSEKSSPCGAGRRNRPTFRRRECCS